MIAVRGSGSTIVDVGVDVDVDVDDDDSDGDRMSSVIISAPFMKYRDLLRQLQDDGWQHIRTTGSHLHFKHPTKPGLVTVPAGGKGSHDIPPGTLRSILRQAGLK